MKTRKVYQQALAGKYVYPLWRLDKNISWRNFFTWPMGIIWGVLTFEWIQKKHKYMIWRLKPWCIWMPPVYAKNYYIDDGKDEKNDV